MADPKDAERLTGYLVGGNQPGRAEEALKDRGFNFSAESLAKIYVSGGKRGLDIGLKPQDLAQVLGASFADIIDE